MYYQSGLDVIACQLCMTWVPSGTRPRKKNIKRYEPTDWDDSLPYGGKVYLARKKKPDSWFCIAIQVLCHANVEIMLYIDIEMYNVTGNMLFFFRS